MPGKFLLKTSFFCLFLVLGTGLFSQNRRAVMVQGNKWLVEAPFLGGNETAVLFGEYRIENRSGTDENEGVFYVKVSGNPLLLSGKSWQARPGTPGLQQLVDGTSLYIGHVFAGGHLLGSWTIIFQFYGADLDGLGTNRLDAVTINRLISIWTDRFKYFLSLVKFTSDMSLPAVVDF